MIIVNGINQEFPAVLGLPLSNNSPNGKETLDGLAAYNLIYQLAFIVARLMYTWFKSVATRC